MFRTANVTFKITQGHWCLCHSIGRVRFSSLPLRLCVCHVPFSIYYQLFLKI